MILDSLIKNVGKVAIEVASWENDGDHYENNVFFYEPDSEELALATKILNMLPYVDLNEATTQGELKLLDRKALDMAIEFVGGYEYESDHIRSYEDHRIYVLNNLEIEEHPA